MKKALMGVMSLLAAAGGVGAQEENLAPERRNAGASFYESSASPATLFSTSEPGSFALANPSGEASAVPAPATPAAKPRYIFGTRDDYRWQLGVGVEYFHFQSNVFDANMVGLNTSLTYYTNSWFGLEGNVVTGFGPQVFGPGQGDAKIFGGVGGFRIGARRSWWEPWGHGLVGGSHLQPQTAAGSRNALMALAGGGVDFRLHARLSLQVEGDWVYTGYFSQAQNNFQAVAGIVLHF
jgi:hypothetical protein